MLLRQCLCHKSELTNIGFFGGQLRTALQFNYRRTANLIRLEGGKPTKGTTARARYGLFVDRISSAALIISYIARSMARYLATPARAAMATSELFFENPAVIHAFRQLTGTAWNAITVGLDRHSNHRVKLGSVFRISAQRSAVMKTLLLGVFLFISASTVHAGGQTVIPSYAATQRGLFWTKLYTTGGRDLYCNVRYSADERLTVEHAYAADWIATKHGCANRNSCLIPAYGFAEADLHNLRPAIGAIDSSRGGKQSGRAE